MTDNGEDRSKGGKDTHKASPILKAESPGDRNISIYRAEGPGIFPSHTMQVFSTTQSFRHSPSQPAIERLPNELLGMIFKLAENDCVGHSHPLGARAPLNVSWVSKSWRQLANNMPALWASIDDTNAHMAPLFLERSGSAGLEIELARSHINSRRYKEFFYPRKLYWEYIDRLDEFFDPLVPYTSRWKSLQLDGPTRDEVMPFLALPAPRLEDLCLDANDGCAEAVETGDAPQSLFGGFTPSLRHLTLVGVAIPLTSSIYLGLISLQLFQVTFQISPLRQLVQNLAACPLLEELSLGRLGFEPHSDDEPVHRPAVVVLPRLRAVSLNGLLSGDTRYLLRLIRSSASLWIHDEDGGDILEFFPLDEDVAKILPNLCSTFKLRVWVYPLGDSCILHGITPDSPAIIHQFRLEGPHNDNGPNIVRRTFAVIGQRFAYPQLRTLWVEGLCESALDPALFARVLGDLPTVTSISLRSASMCFIETLIVTPESQPCPLLRDLELVQCAVKSQSLIALVASRAPRRDGNGQADVPPTIDHPDSSELGKYLRRIRLVGMSDIVPETIQTLESFLVEVLIPEGPLQWPGPDPFDVV